MEAGNAVGEQAEYVNPRHLTQDFPRGESRAGGDEADVPGVNGKKKEVNQVQGQEHVFDAPVVPAGDAVLPQPQPSLQALPSSMLSFDGLQLQRFLRGLTASCRSSILSFVIITSKRTERVRAALDRLGLALMLTGRAVRIYPGVVCSLSVWLHVIRRIRGAVVFICMGVSRDEIILSFLYRLVRIGIKINNAGRNLPLLLLYLGDVQDVQYFTIIRNFRSLSSSICRTSGDVPAHYAHGSKYIHVGLEILQTRCDTS
jgi:hypothetical protein